MARGIRAACAAGGLNNPGTIAAVDSSQFTQGCFNVNLVKVGDSKQFCSERDIFAYLVANYCGSKPDGVLPSAMGSLQYPPASWIQIATVSAAMGAFVIIWALFGPSCSKDLDGCVAAQMNGPPTARSVSPEPCRRDWPALTDTQHEFVRRRLCCRSSRLGICLCPCSKPIPCACCPRVQRIMRRKALQAEEKAILSQLDELKRQTSASLRAQEQAILREIAENERRQEARRPVRAMARALPVAPEPAPAPAPEPEPDPEPEPEPEPERELIEF